MKLPTTLHRKAFPLILMYSIASILCCLTVPMATGSSSKVTFRVEPTVTGGVSVGGLVQVDIYIDAPEGSAITGWVIDVEVDPSVLEPGFYFFPPGIDVWVKSSASGYFLYDWATANNYTTEFTAGDRNVTAGKITGPIEGVTGWTDLERGEGANGTGKLATLYFTSKNETAYSPIEITKAYYYTSWNTPYLDKHAPDIIFHGHYNEPTYDVAVTAISAPSQATVGDIVPINVTVDNLAAPAALNLTLTYGTAIIETRLMSLASATSKNESFTWNTAGLTPGEYVINATAIRPGDVNLTNNFDTTTITLLVHDVAVTSVSAPANVTVGEIVPISVDVANEGGFTETFSVTVRYGLEDIDTKTVTDLAAGGSTTVDFEWPVTDVAPGTHTITAEAILEGDVNLTNNFDTTTITLLAHDVAITDIRTSSYKVDINDPSQLTVTISVDVANEGDFTETFDVTVRYDATDIDTKTVTDLAAGGSTTVDFEWPVTDVPLRTYTIEAEAILAGDDDPADNKMTSEWTIDIVPEFPTEIPLLLMLAVLAVSTIILKRRTRKHPLTRRLRR